MPSTTLTDWRPLVADTVLSLKDGGSEPHEIRLGSCYLEEASEEGFVVTTADLLFPGNVMTRGVLYICAIDAWELWGTYVALPDGSIVSQDDDDFASRLAEAGIPEPFPYRYRYDSWRDSLIDGSDIHIGEDGWSR